MGAVRVDEPRPDAPEARPFDLVLVAMGSTLRPPPTRARQRGECRRSDAPSVAQRSGRTMVSRPGRRGHDREPLGPVQLVREVAVLDPEREPA